MYHAYTCTDESKGGTESNHSHKKLYPLTSTPPLIPYPRVTLPFATFIPPPPTSTSPPTLQFHATLPPLRTPTPQPPTSPPVTFRYAMAVILSSSASTPLTRRKSVGKPRNPQSRLLAGRGLAPLSLALALAHGGARALAEPSITYEEALRQSAGGGDGGDFSLPDIEFSLPDVNFALPDLGLDGFIRFLTENPLVVAGAVAVVAVPVVLGQVLGGAKSYSVVSASSAYQKLLEEPGAQLVDIRSVKDAREAGSPNLREAKKKAVALPYNGEDKDGFLKKLGLRFKDPENTTLIILDKSDGNSQQVAELVAANGFKAAFAVKDGAEGRRGWLNSNLPWTSPKKGLSFNLGDLFGDSSDGLPLTIGLAAATGFGVFAYTEIETLLQILGSAAIIQLLASKLLYAEDRKKTLKQIEEFFNTKVAPKELVDEIKEIGQALLPTEGTPAAARTSSAPAADTTEGKAATTSSAPAADTTEVKAASAATEPSASVNSAPVAEVSARPRSLSPYPNYPDLKPPSSPSPSTP